MPDAVGHPEALVLKARALKGDGHERCHNVMPGFARSSVLIY